MGFIPYLVMPTVLDGDFEWDSLKAEANLVKYRFPRRRQSLRTRSRCTSTMDRQTGEWWLSGPRFVNGFFSLSTSNVVSEIGSSAHGAQRRAREKSTSLEVNHETRNQAPSPGRGRAGAGSRSGAPSAARRPPYDANLARGSRQDASGGGGGIEDRSGGRLALGEPRDFRRLPGLDSSALCCCAGWTVGARGGLWGQENRSRGRAVRFPWSGHAGKGAS